MVTDAHTQLEPSDLSRIRQRVGEHLEGSAEGRGVRVGIACSRFNGSITVRLLDAALDALYANGVGRADVSVAWAPGAFELPLLARAFVHAPQPVDVVLALGAVIRGDTGHYEIVAEQCARGILHVQLQSGVPIVFGVLTVNNVDQALERSQNDDSNKGREAALTALEMVSVLTRGSLGP